MTNMRRIISQICAVAIRHRIIILSAFTTAVFFPWLLHSDIALKFAARYHFLEKQGVFRVLCPPPQFSNLTFQATALATYPESGNTMLRHLIQEATGILTGSQWDNAWLFGNAFPAEGNTNTSTIFMETYRSDDEAQLKYSKVIILVRDPKNTTLTLFRSHFGAKNDPYPEKIIFEQYWRQFVKINVKAWLRFYNEWLHFFNPVLIVTYQDLVSNTEEEIRRIATFLQVPINSRGLICALSTKKWFIGRKFTPPIELYTPEMSTYLDKVYNDTLFALLAMSNKFFYM